MGRMVQAEGSGTAAARAGRSCWKRPRGGGGRQGTWVSDSHRERGRCKTTALARCTSCDEITCNHLFLDIAVVLYRSGKEMLGS